jgi:hypothetical protein
MRTYVLPLISTSDRSIKVLGIGCSIYLDRFGRHAVERELVAISVGIVLITTCLEEFDQKIFLLIACACSVLCDVHK